MTCLCAFSSGAFRIDRGRSLFVDFHSTADAKREQKKKKKKKKKKRETRGQSSHAVRCCRGVFLRRARKN